MNDSRPPLEDLPDGEVSAILDFARERRIRSAHDVGNADRALIGGLAGIDAWTIGRGYDLGVLRDSVKIARKPRPIRAGPAR